MHDSTIPSTIPFRTLGRPSGATLAVLGGLVLLGLLAVILGALGGAGERVWEGLLFNWLFWSALSMGMVVFAVALHITEAEWAWSIRRFALGGVAFLPISFLLLLVVLFGGAEHYFHHWLHAEGDPIIEAKAGWLNLPLLTARDILLVGGLYVLAICFAYFSLRPDVHGAGDERHRSLYDRLTQGWRGAREEAERSHHILNRMAPAIALLYTLIFGMVAVDLAMSLEPHWFSTMFPVAFFWTGFHGGVAMTAIAVAVLRPRLRLEDYVTTRQFHDLGKLVFAFSVFWMYLNWSQYIVIWYGLLPWEQPWFAARFQGAYAPLVQAVVMLVFVLPFLGLLSRAPKMVPGILAFFATLILIGHWIERFLLVAPSIRGEFEGFPLGLVEIGIGLGFAGLFLLAYLWYARSFPLLPSPATLDAQEPTIVSVPAVAAAKS